MQVQKENNDLVMNRFEALNDISSLRSDLSELHKQLAISNESNAELHNKLEGMHEEKIKAFGEVEVEMNRTESEATKRREAEAKVRAMEANIKSLAGSNDTVRFFQESESRRRGHEATISTLRKQLADSSGTNKALQQEVKSIKKHVRWSEGVGGGVADPNVSDAFSPPRNTFSSALKLTPTAAADGGIRGSGSGGVGVVDFQAVAVVVPETTTEATTSTVLLAPKSPAEFALLEETVVKVDLLKVDVLDLSEVLLTEREETAARLEECLDVVEDAELTAEAAKEVGAEAAAEALELGSSQQELEANCRELSSQLEACKEQLKDAELELVEAKLENEGLRSQLASNGIEPEMSWWKEEALNGRVYDNDGSGVCCVDPNASKDHPPRAATSSSSSKMRNGSRGAGASSSTVKSASVSVRDAIAAEHGGEEGGNEGGGGGGEDEDGGNSNAGKEGVEERRPAAGAMAGRHGNRMMHGRGGTIARWGLSEVEKVGVPSGSVEKLDIGGGGGGLDKRDLKQKQREAMENALSEWKQLGDAHDVR